MDQRNPPPGPDLSTAVADILNNAALQTREQVADLVAQRIRELHSALVPKLEREFESSAAARAEAARREATRDFTARINLCLQRMREYESDRHWCDALLDASADLCRRSAFFSVRGENLCIQGMRGRGIAGTVRTPEIPVRNARAFHKVIATGQADAAARSAEDLSEPVSGWFAEPAGAEIVLIPVIAADRVAGVLYVEGADDIGSLETLALAAGSALENHLLRDEGALLSGRGYRPAIPQQSAMVSTSGEQAVLRGSEPPENPAALRAASVAVAQMLLNRYDAVRRGRETSTLYAEMRTDIDTARKAFSKQHGSAPDYLHRELVRTLAQGNPELLGPGYPGEVV